MILLTYWMDGGDLSFPHILLHGKAEMSGASKSLPRFAPDFSDGLRSNTTDRTDKSPTTIFKNRMLRYFRTAGTIKV